MKLSARNVIEGTVKNIEMGSVNAVVSVEIAEGIMMTSVITIASCKQLGLEAGKPASVIIKASNVMIGVD